MDHTCFSLRVQNVQVGNNIIHINCHQVTFCNASPRRHTTRNDHPDPISLWGCVSTVMSWMMKKSWIQWKFMNITTETVKKKKKIRHPCQNQRTGCVGSWSCPIIIPKRFYANPRAVRKIEIIFMPVGCVSLLWKWLDIIIKKKQKQTKNIQFLSYICVCVVCKDREGVIRPPWCRGVWVCRAVHPCWAGRTLPGGSGLWTW